MIPDTNPVKLSEQIEDAMHELEIADSQPSYRPGVATMQRWKALAEQLEAQGQGTKVLTDFEIQYLVNSMPAGEWTDQERMMRGIGVGMGLKIARDRGYLAPSIMPDSMQVIDHLRPLTMEQRTEFIDGMLKYLRDNGYLSPAAQAEHLMSAPARSHIPENRQGPTEEDIERIAREYATVQGVEVIRKEEWNEKYDECVEYNEGLLHYARSYYRSDPDFISGDEARKLLAFDGAPANWFTEGPARSIAKKMSELIRSSLLSSADPCEISSATPENEQGSKAGKEIREAGNAMRRLIVGNGGNTYWAEVAAAWDHALSLLDQQPNSEK